MHNGQLRINYCGQDLAISARSRLASGHMIVLLHGFGCAKECFDSVFSDADLARFSLLAFDFPGHGASDGFGQPLMYSLQAYADVSNMIIDQLAPEMVTLVGHSMGGAVSLIASQERKDIFGIVDADGNLVAEDCGIVSRATASQSRSLFRERGFSEFLKGLQSSADSSEVTWARWYANADPVALHESARSLVEWSDSGKLLDLFNAQDNAVYVYGELDSKEYLLPELKNSFVRTIANSGHFMMLDNPAAFARAVADFVGAFKVSVHGVSERHVGVAGCLNL
jgi:pimeloyl-ACP methyl ester carboxylesterase